MRSPESFRPQLPENEGENDLKEIDLGELDSSIEEYNRQFNWGTLLGEEIADTIDEGEEKPPRQKLSAEQLGKMHELALEKTGLSLEPVRGIATMYTGDKEVPSSEMRMNVADGNKFVGYLTALDEQSLTESQVRGLKMVAESFSLQLTQQYELGNPDDERTMKLFGNLDQIIQQYKRLDEQGKTGLAGSVEELGTYLDVARKGYLREYVLAKNEKLLAKPDDKVFGPSDWWGDSSPQSFKEMYWEKALAAAKKIGENPKAQDFYGEVVENLKASLRHTKAQLKNPPEYFRKEDAEEKLIIVDELYDTLEKM